MASTTISAHEVDQALWALQGYDTTALATMGSAGPHVAGVFFAPERTATGLRLVTAMLRDSRKHREILEDPRVAFLCSPGAPTRWIQGAGRATAVEERDRWTALFAQLLEHAPGAQPFIDNLVVLPVIIDVTHLKVVTDPAGAGFEVDLTTAAR